MTEKMIYTYNHAEGTEILEPMSAEEIALQEASAQAKADRIAAEIEKENKKKSAAAKLIDLGLDEDEVKAFLGIQETAPPRHS